MNDFEIVGSVLVRYHGTDKNIAIPDGVTVILLPNSLINLGVLAFNECASLNNVIIPESITSIIEWAFIGCPFQP